MIAYAAFVRAALLLAAVTTPSDLSPAVFTVPVAAATAHEHIRLKRAEPGVNDTVAAPTAIKLWFSETVISFATTIRVAGPDRKSAALSEVTVEKGELAPAVAMVRETLKPGVYTVDWKTMASDGDAMNGSFVFTVAARPSPVPGNPALVTGDFDDDYGSRHTVSATEWIQHPRNRYRIVKWVPEQQYLIAQNDSSNRGAGNKWTRIDWVPLPGMAPYDWAFCFSAFDKSTADEAEAVAVAKRETPKTGCNGYPFSRMKRRP